MKKRILLVVLVVIASLFVNAETCSQDEECLSGTCTGILTDIKDILLDDVTYPAKIQKISATAILLKNYFNNAGNGDTCNSEDDCAGGVCAGSINPSVISWKKTNGPGGGKIIDIAFDNTNKDIFYTAVYPISSGLLDGGIYKTTDGGTTWQRKINGINDKETWSVSIDPNNNNILWAGTNSGEIYKTTNHGDMWALQKEGIFDTKKPLLDTIYTIEINPFDSNIILAGSRHGNLLKSTDGGNSWITTHNEKGLNVEGVISDITFDSDNEGVVYLTSGFFDVWDFVGNGIYKSIDAGDTWTRLENGLEEKTQFGDLVIDPSNSNVLYAANGMETTNKIVGEDKGYLYRSENAGSNWERIDIGSQFSEKFTLNSVVIHPQNPDLIYVLGQDQRVLISEDRGKTWELIIDSGIIGIGTFVEYHPLDSNIMYATTYAAGIFKSTDGGRTWEDLNGKEIAFAYIEGLATDPSTSGVIYSHSFSNGFHYSQDYGETWIRGHHSSLYPWTSLIKKSKANNDIYIVGRGDGSIMKTDNPNNGWGFVNNWEISNRIPRAVTMEVSDNNGNLILVGTENQGIFKTNDGGNTWQEINNGLPTNSDVRTIAIDPNNENKVFAGSINNKGRLWQSNNKGNSWDLLNNEMTFTTIHAMEVDFNNQDVVYAAPWGAGLFKSINGGNSWDEIVGGGESERVFSLASIKVHPENSNILYANDRADSLLIKSEDGGNTWFSPWNPGEKEYFRLHTFEFDPNNPEIFYVSAWKVDKGKIMGDLYRHNTDGGFEEITNELPRAVLDVEVDPSNSNIIYSSVHVHGLFKSTDGGDSWQELDSFPRAGIFDLAFNNGKLYATTNCGELPIYMLGGMEQHDGECGVYVSEDGGDSWNNLLPVTMRSTAVKQVAFDNYNNLYIATNNDAYFASDGNLWIPLNVPFKETATIQVTTNKIYVGTHGGGVYYKQIDASNWNNNGPHTTLLNMQIEVNPLDSNILYASSFPGGIFKSEDGGSTWNEKNFALPSFKVDNPDLQAYYSFLINPYNSNNLFLGMFGKGVYMSLDGANTWMPINKGLGNKHIYNIQLDASGNHLYVGTNGGSVYTTKLS